MRTPVEKQLTLCVYITASGGIKHPLLLQNTGKVLIIWIALRVWHHQAISCSVLLAVLETSQEDTQGENKCALTFC